MLYKAIKTLASYAIIMMNEIKLLVFLLTGTGVGGEMHRVAVKVNGDDYHANEMQYYGENNALKEFMKLPKECVILRIEELEGILV